MPSNTRVSLVTTNPPGPSINLNTVMQIIVPIAKCRLPRTPEDVVTADCRRAVFKVIECCTFAHGRHSSHTILLALVVEPRKAVGIESTGTSARMQRMQNRCGKDERCVSTNPVKQCFVHTQEKMVG